MLTLELCIFFPFVIRVIVDVWLLLLGEFHQAQSVFWRASYTPNGFGINDLKNSLKFAKASHFADDTCLTYSNKNPETLESNLNYDLKNLTQWLRANRLSLNVDKTKLLIFKSKFVSH